MARFIALLRAINVGGHTVKMDELRRLFSAMGFAAVETFIASGNVIFDADADSTAQLERKIAAGLQQALGYEVATFVRSAQQFAQIAAQQPFGALPDGAGLYIAFLAEPLKAAAQQRLLEQQTDTDQFHVHGREIYWLCHGRFSDSPFSGPRLEKLLGVLVTVRNASSVRKLAAKYPPP